MKYRGVLTHEQNEIVRRLREVNKARTPGVWEGDGDYVWVGEQGIEFEKDDADTLFLALVTKHIDTLLEIIEERVAVI